MSAQGGIAGRADAPAPDVKAGDPAPQEELLPLVYAELRRRAAGHLRRERAGHSLRPSDLVHETYVRRRDQNPARRNREQFFAVASRLLRRILVDHAARAGRPSAAAACA